MFACSFSWTALDSQQQLKTHIVDRYFTDNFLRRTRQVQFISLFSSLFLLIVHRKQYRKSHQHHTHYSYTSGNGGQQQATQPTVFDTSPTPAYIPAPSPCMLILLYFPVLSAYHCKSKYNSCITIISLSLSRHPQTATANDKNG